jgi:sugar/nucleoside kinase (ribokinase family)
MAAPDFVAVGHVTLDRFGDVVRPGGAALYAVITAHRLGLSAGLLTSHADDFPLDLLPPQIEVVTLPAARTTTFAHAGGTGRRALRVTAAAGPLGPGDVPEDWAGAAIVLMAPVLNEVDPLVAAAFGEGAVGVAAQGYLRRVGHDGEIAAGAWAEPQFLLGKIQALFLSEEDVAGASEAALAWFERVPLGALTAGRDGARLFVNGESYPVRPRPAAEVDETGAGDVFAATFMIEYEREGDPWRAAAAAACAGALAVEGEGWSRVPGREALEAAVAAYLEEE